jgi:membrane associated rhomboid family serine protease
MAFRSNSPTTLTFPPFRGITRRIVLVAIAGFLLSLVASLMRLGGDLDAWMALIPARLLHQPWMLLSYAFVPTGLLSVAFALLSVWLFGAQLEDERGAQWMGEYFFATTCGGALLTTLIALALAHLPASRFALNAGTAGMWPFSVALLLAFARFNPEQQLRFNFVFKVRAKTLAALYILFYVVMALIGGDRLGALLALCAALCGYLYLRFLPRRGMQFAASEQWYGLRNAWFRRKRKSAAKQFDVYMKQHGDRPAPPPKDDTRDKWMN